jgi:methylated-DNA-[protein]-cysteine S-methyltransferase
MVAKKRLQSKVVQCERKAEAAKILLTYDSKNSKVTVTPFRRRVYNALSEVPVGRVTTYKLLADRIGCKSSQAVGQALKNNPFAPSIPCHRVVATNRAIGGFAGARVGAEVERKYRLLKNEGVKFTSDGRVDPSSLFTF